MRGTADVQQSKPILHPNERCHELFQTASKTGCFCDLCLKQRQIPCHSRGNLLRRLQALNRGSRAPRQGAAAVEFALIAPLFLLLLGGIIEFGQAFRIQHSLSSAARRGARAAIIDGASSKDVIQAVKAHCEKAFGIKEGHVSVVVAVNDSSGGNLADASNNDEVRVTVTVPYSKAGVGFFGSLLPKTDITVTCIMEHE